MTRSRRRILAAIAVVIVAAGVSAPRAEAAEPTLTSSVSRGAPGDQIVVTETGWSDTSVVVLCGDAGRRGAPDCDQIGGVGFPVSITRDESRAMTLRAPPVPCPCVLRASTPGEDMVKTIPIELVGFAVAPLAPLDTEQRGALRVSAEVIAGHASIANFMRSALGGPTRRVLVLKLTNTGAIAIRDITVSAALGRSTQGGDTLQAPNVDPLGPNESRSYAIDVSLNPPSYGAYKVFGTVYSSAGPVGFAVTTRTTPGLLYLVVAILLVDLLAIAALRTRRRLREREQQAQRGRFHDANEAELDERFTASEPGGNIR